MSWEKTFVERLASAKLANVFNPYSDRCEVHDLEAAATIRRNNLETMLDVRKRTGIDSIWFGRDLGYRGGRRTGLALTDEVAMFNIATGVANSRGIQRATNGKPVAERTAAVIWSVINRLERPPMLWNAFPLHPHQPDAPFTNRAHSTRERRETAWTIEALIERFDHPQLIAIGNDAAKALSDLGFNHELARHPSYGGQRAFVETMEQLHDLSPASEQREPTLL